MTSDTKARNQRFNRRKFNLVKKADQLARLCGIDLALIIRKNGRYYTYRSLDNDQWPPTLSEIVSRQSPSVILVLTKAQNTTYPLPVNLLPKDMSK